MLIVLIQRILLWLTSKHGGGLLGGVCVEVLLEEEALLVLLGEGGESGLTDVHSASPATTLHLVGLEHVQRHYVELSTKEEVIESVSRLFRKLANMFIIFLIRKKSNFKK